MNYDYDLAIIGAGTAGLAAAFEADALGKKVALIEANKVGGEYLWRGGIAAQTIIRSAQVYDLVQRAEEFGVHLEKQKIVWNAIPLRVADVRDEVRSNQRAKLSKSKIELITGTAKFSDPHTVEIATGQGSKTLTAAAFIVATGSQEELPKIEGLADAGGGTAEKLLARKTQPRSIVFIGGGSTAAELAQAFKRFGATVTILQPSEQLLPDEEPAISSAIETLLRNQGVEIHLQCRVLRITPGESRKTVEFETEAGPAKAEGGEVIAIGERTPNITDLNLEAAGVALGEHGIAVANFLQTSAGHIYAIGSVTGRDNYEYEARLAARNAVAEDQIPIGNPLVPHVTFTDPEIARLGLTSEEAEVTRGTVQVVDVPFKSLDRAIIEGETSGFARVVTSESSQILGVHIIGHHASELISAFIPAVRNEVSLQELAAGIYPSPTLSEIVRRLAEQTNP